MGGCWSHAIGKFRDARMEGRTTSVTQTLQHAGGAYAAGIDVGDRRRQRRQHRLRARRGHGIHAHRTADRQSAARHHGLGRDRCRSGRRRGDSRHDQQRTDERWCRISDGCAFERFALGYERGGWRDPDANGEPSTSKAAIASPSSWRGSAHRSPVQRDARPQAASREARNTQRPGDLFARPPPQRGSVAFGPNRAPPAHRHAPRPTAPPRHGIR